MEFLYKTAILKFKYLRFFTIGYQHNLDLKKPMPFLPWLRADFINNHFSLTTFTLGTGKHFAVMTRPLSPSMSLLYQGRCPNSGDCKRLQDRNETCERKQPSVSQRFLWAIKTKNGECIFLHLSMPFTLFPLQLFCNFSNPLFIFQTLMQIFECSSYTEYFTPIYWGGKMYLTILKIVMIVNKYLLNKVKY